MAEENLEIRGNKIEGFSFVDGTADDFDPANLKANFIHFVRTTNNKENGYVYFNGKKYGNTSRIDAGEYPDHTND